MVLAKDIMSEVVVVVPAEMPMRQVAHLMLRDRVSGFPVVNNNKEVVGIVTMTDLFSVIQQGSADQATEEFYKNIPQFQSLLVSDVMSGNVVSISPDTSLREIITLVVEKNIHSFPVMKEGKIVGIVSRHDILNAIFAYE